MTVFFVGPVPPPINGFSMMNQAMLDKISTRTTTILIDRAPEPSGGPRGGAIRRVLNTIEQLARLAATLPRTDQRVLYVGLSGGWGQIFDAAFCLIGRFTKTRILFHHHSFAYINRRSRLTSLVFAISREAQHIVLCPCMGRKLCQAYGLSAKRILHLSNAALLQDCTNETTAEISITGAAVASVGYLSNITADKGIFEFFDALDLLASRQIKFSAKVAGPIEESIKTRFFDRISRIEQAEYIGPVYGNQKQKFFASLDFLLFPTKYVNEAEPVILLEAMRQGVYVLATERGCISGMIPSGSGSVVQIAEFSLAVAQVVMDRNKMGPAEAQAARLVISATSEYEIQCARLRLDAIMKVLCESP